MNRKKLLEICDNFNLASALYKCSYDGTELYGYLTPAEIIALIDSAGVVLVGSKIWQVDRLRQCKRKGDCSPRSFYCELHGELKNLWEKFHPDRFDPKLMK